jgi:hypothetical protein
MAMVTAMKNTQLSSKNGESTNADHRPTRNQYFDRARRRNMDRLRGPRLTGTPLSVAGGKCSNALSSAKLRWSPSGICLL